MRARDILPEKWSEKYKRSIDCSHPKGFSQRAHCQGRKKDEDQHPNEKPRGPETKPTMPQGTVRVDVSDVYDWYKLGQHISRMKGLGKHDFGKGPPSTIFSFGSEDEEHKYIKDLEKIGLTTTDIDPKDPKQPKGMKKQKTDPTYNVESVSRDDADALITHFREFLELCMEELDLDKLPKIRWLSSGDLHKQKHTFGLFKNKDQMLEVEITGRHPIDIMRTLAHELVHYRQFLDGRLTKHSGETGSAIENEAHAITGIIMRKFDDRHPDSFELKPIVEDISLNELNVSQTLKFIQQAHGDQLYGKLPYWRHPRSVALTGKKIFGKNFNSDAVKVAFLHDVVEDTSVSLDELHKMDFRPEVIEAVGLLTKNKSLTYVQNIENIINSGNKLAMMVKYADNYENYTGDKSSWDPQKAASSQKKYLNSLNMLGNKLGVKSHIGENFADGKGPGRPGDSQRHGIPKGATMAQLEKAAKSGGRKGQLARWQLNMRRGRKK